MSFHCCLRIETKLSALKPSYDLEDLSSVTSCMFTLLDLCLKTLTKKNVTNLYVKPSGSPEVFHEVPEADILSPETWMPIKGNSTSLRVKKADKKMGSLRAVHARTWQPHESQARGHSSTTSSASACEKSPCSKSSNPAHVVRAYWLSPLYIQSGLTQDAKKSLGPCSAPACAALPYYGFQLLVF